MNKPEKPGGYGYGQGVLSNSLISDALHCGYKFHVTYERQQRPDVEASYFSVGQIVHDAIEDFHKEGRAAPSSSQAQLAWLMDRMQEGWKTHFGEVVASELLIFHEALNKAMEETIDYGKTQGKDWVRPQMTGYWKSKHQLRFKLWEENQIKPLMREVKRVRFTDNLTNLFQQTTKCLENFVEMHAERSLPNSLLSEYEIVPIEFQGNKISGKIDRVELNFDVYGAVNDIKVFDYKTGAKKRWKEEDVKNSSQLLWYSFALQEVYDILPSEIGIYDLYNKNIVKVGLESADIHRFLERLETNVDFLAMREHWKEKEGKTIIGPIPAGTGGFGCPCDLAYTRNEEIRCPYYKPLEES